MYSSFEEYAQKNHTKLGQGELDFGKNLLKSYVLETSRHSDETFEIERVFRNSPLSVTRMEEGDLYVVSGKQGDFGYLEAIDNRYLLLHTQRETSYADRVLQSFSFQSSRIDTLWLAGDAFGQLLNEWIVPSYGDRYVQIKADFQPRFERGNLHDVWFDDFNDEEDDTKRGRRRRRNQDAKIPPPPAQTSTLNRPASRLAALLNEYQRIDRPWRAIKTLRLPSSEFGGYELYSWGKMTHRASSFSEGVDKLRFVVSLYRKVTEAIEDVVWMNTEPVRVRDETYLYGDC